MSFFLILLPFLVLGALNWLFPITIGLFAGATVALALIVHERIKGRSAKILNIASVVIFSSLGAIVLLTNDAWSHATIRIAIDIALLSVVLVSIVLRFPFTLQYAREHVTPEVRVMPEFIRTNYVLTWVWVGAFALMLVADMLSVWWPSAPLWVGVIIAFSARNAAVQFTKWYSQRARDRANAVTTNATI
ncbi:hypothetical protein [Bradyrhizobium prioriisuperbiae]|uniref:hypothetical protein n=1 Tax=Bradyrhizobium prioriisuperbiae TaxID=2854389 RepID=UPI0028E53BC4|nr:hypothetical protein [Bradyrhizobium prioritasuperba]